MQNVVGTPMTIEILDVINAVISYGKYLACHNHVIPRDEPDFVARMQKYYRALPLPEGMKRNREDFERILQIGWYSSKELERLNNADANDLQKIRWKN